MNKLMGLRAQDLEERVERWNGVDIPIVFLERRDENRTWVINVTSLP